MWRIFYRQRRGYAPFIDTEERSSAVQKAIDEAQGFIHEGEVCTFPKNWRASTGKVLVGIHVRGKIDPHRTEHHHRPTWIFTVRRKNKSPHYGKRRS